MPHAPASRLPVANLGERLAALVQDLQAATCKQGSTIHFDYIGLTMFPWADVQALAQCVHRMIDQGLHEALNGHGALFLTVHAWSLSADKARVTVRLAYTVRSGVRELDKLSLLFKQPISVPLDEACDMPGMADKQLMLAFSAGVNAECVAHTVPGESAVIELRLSLPHGGAEHEPACLTELSTVSAWLIGDLPDENALLARRLQRDGWLVRQFDDIGEALRFWASSHKRLEPALVIATSQGDMPPEDLVSARQAWSSQCHIICGVHAEHVTQPGLAGLDIDIKKLPFSPTDLRDIKEIASLLEARRTEASRLQKRDASRLRPIALVVDDAPVNRILATEMLQALGYDSDTADNGQEAVEYVERYRPDVILMDLQMPVMDGMEATERIRRYERHGAGRYTPIPIIATTTLDEQDVSKSWEAIGMSAFVPKPLMLERLALALPPMRHGAV